MKIPQCALDRHRQCLKRVWSHGARQQARKHSWVDDGHSVNMCTDTEKQRTFKIYQHDPKSQASTPPCYAFCSSLQTALLVSGPWRHDALTITRQWTLAT